MFQPGPEKLLAKYLIKKYEEIGIAGRPVANVGDLVNLKVGLNVNKIIKAENNQATVAAFLVMQWTDPYLDFDPAKFGGVQAVALPAKSIWTPDLVIYNHFCQGGIREREAMQEADVLVMAGGQAIWVPKMVYTTGYKPDPNNPGQFKIELLGGSWVYDTTKISVKLDKPDIDVDTFDTTPGIQVVGHSATAEDREFAVCPGVKYTLLHFNIVFKKD